MSEFGATTSQALAGFDTEWAGIEEVGWAYWAWKYYDDPTGSSAEGLVLPDGSYSPIVEELSRTYPQEVAGTASAISFNPFTGAFGMNYTPSVAASGDTVVSLAAQQHYPHGWCTAVRGGRITSAPGSSAPDDRHRGQAATGLHDRHRRGLSLQELTGAMPGVAGFRCAPRLRRLGRHGQP